MNDKIDNKVNIELSAELENESFKIQVKELELDGRYLFIRGIVLDVDKKEASEFEDSIDLLDFCCNDNEPDNDNNLNDDDEQVKET